MYVFEFLQKVLCEASAWGFARGSAWFRSGWILTRRVAVTAAVVGLTVPVAGLEAAEVAVAGSAAILSRTTSVIDVRLSSGGTLAGHVVDGSGRPVADIAVTVFRSGRRVGSGATRSDGSFTMIGLHGGVHQLEAGGARYSARLWTATAAPPAAISRIMVVHARDTVRGQLEPGPIGRGYERAKYWLADPLVVAGIVAVAVAIPVAVHNANSDRDSGS